MSPSRLLHSLLALVFMVISLSMVSPAAACCGENPNWFVDVFVTNQPLCSNRDVGGSTGGSVTWGANYHLSSQGMNGLSTHVFGDGVITETKYTGLPNQPGAPVNTMTKTTTWKWDPNYRGTTRTVRVQLDLGGMGDFREGAMIRITCVGDNLFSWLVTNVEGYWD